MDDECLNLNYYCDEFVEVSIWKMKEVIEYIEKVDLGFDIVVLILILRFVLSCFVEVMIGFGEL